MEGMDPLFINSFSRGAGAAPLPEREVPSQTPFSFVVRRRRQRTTKTNEAVLAAWAFQRDDDTSRFAFADALGADIFAV